MRLALSRTRWLLLGSVAVAAAAATTYWQWPAKKVEPTADPFALPPLSASPYLNTGPDARYVGSEACRTCHEERHATFRCTGMGRSMADIDLAQEPPDSVFEHAPSKRRYEVRRRDGQLWHRELLLTAGPELVLAEYPMKYVIGSGRHTRSYLVEADGFLVESPVTWYTSKKAWAMSPGYDRPDHPGFERPAGVGCLYCHAGSADAVGLTLHKMKVTEPAIACERCHGPGSLHTEKHASRGAPSGSREHADLTIVNPARLSRDLGEAVCQQCHLRCTAMVPARGRTIADFRPGLPFSDVMHAFMLQTPDRKMTVVGHVEQMHLSKCYQFSNTLTCLTCHSPHSEPGEDTKVAHYRTACQQCHSLESCRVEPARRMRESPANDCVHCHMPRSPTEIPHLAFTHHRIGIHGNTATGSDPGSVDLELKPFLDLSRLSSVDLKRSLGLGYLEAANLEKDPANASRFRNRAFDYLSAMHDTGLRDGGLETALARVRFELELGEYLPHAQLAQQQGFLQRHDRSGSLFLIGDAQARNGNAREAASAFRELTKLRRGSMDWMLLAECEKELGNNAAADAALLEAVRINPRLTNIHQYLAEQFSRQGDTKRAAWHKQRATQ